MKETGMGTQIAGFVLGIISIFFCYMMYFNFIGLILAIIGLVLSRTGKNTALQSGASTGFGTAGIVLSTISICVCLLSIVFFLLIFLGAFGLVYSAI